MKLLQKFCCCFFKVFFVCNCLFRRSWISTGAGLGRWHPVIQLLFPLACAGCSPLASAARAISSLKKSQRRKIRKETASTFASLVPQMMPGQDVILGCGV